MPILSGISPFANPLPRCSSAASWQKSGRGCNPLPLRGARWWTRSPANGQESTGAPNILMLGWFFDTQKIQRCVVDYSQKKTEQIYQKCVVVAQKSKIGLGLKFDPHSPHSSRPGCARLVNSSLVKRPMLCSCNQWVFVCLWNLQTSSCNHGQTSRCTFRYSSSISWWNIK